MKNVKRLGTILLTGAILTTTIPVNALEKNETVYSKLNNDGSVKSTVVSEYLKNSDETINDVTNLTNILNINGNEKFKIDGTNITWDAKGKDIYYQGETEAELPVNLQISYKLDGKDIKLEDLLGQKGKVTITLKYTNKEKHSVLVNGSYQTLYTPFIVTLGTIIPNAKNSNIEVTNGKVVSNGKSSVVVAVASPGLYESLNSESLKDMDTIEISYDTKKFELSSIYSVVSSGLIEQDDLKVFDKLDGIYSKVNTLSESSDKLVSGSNELLEGSKKLNEGANTLSTKLNEAYLGSKKLNETLKVQATDNSAVLTDEQIASIKSTTQASVNANITAMKSTIEAMAVAQLEADTEYQTYTTQMNAIVTGLSAAGMSEDDILACIAGGTDANCTTYATQIGQYGQLKAITDGLKKVAKETAYQTAQTVANLVVSGNETTAGVAESVASQVAVSTKQKTISTINESVTTLTNGLSQLNSGASDLATGSTNLTNGVNTLAEGITKFDSEGIDQIAKLVNGDVKTTEEKVEALIKLGETYDSFTMKADDAEGETKFILMVDAQKKVAKTETNKATKKETKSSILDKLKKLF